MVPLVAGSLILATLLVPLMTRRSSATFDMSHGMTRTNVTWDVMDEMRGQDCSYLICAWVIGAATLATCLFVRGLALRLAHVGLGLLGIMLFWLAISSLGLGPFSPKSALAVFSVLSMSSMRPMLWWYWSFAAVCLTTVISIRIRLGNRPSMRVVVGVFAVTLAVLTTIGFFTTISDFNAINASFDGLFGGGEGNVTLYFMAMLGAVVAMAVACAMALVDVGTLAADRKQLARGALATIYGTLVLLLFFLCFYSLHPGGRFRVVLFMVSTFVLIGGLCAIFSSGVINLTVLLVEMADKRLAAWTAANADGVPTAMAAPPAPAVPMPITFAAPAAPPAPPGCDLADRLARLQSLLDNGTISQEEYAAERHRILADI